MTGPVTRLVLPNGLTIQLREIHTAPIISHWIWYRVGSRDELPGLTGLSHWVEHMQFKGTPLFPNAVLDKAIAREGGVWNAFTYLDWTTYYETLPADKIDLALRLEADRMVNSLFISAEVESERTVIISEREGNENQPLFRLGEAVQHRSFSLHPYHHEVIGELEDLKGIQRDDLYQHYRTYYQPDNAVLAMAGDFDTDAMLARIVDLYRDVPAEITARRVPTAEPPLADEQQVEVRGPGQTQFIQLAYRAPGAASEDFFYCAVLDSLLTGPMSLNMFGGGGISNKTSRLYRALVENELVVSVHGGLQATLDPFMYDITLTVRDDKTPEEVLAVLDRELAQLQDAKVTEQEINRAIKQARAMFAYGSENITNQAFWLGYAEMFATYDWFRTYLERLAAVTPGDVQRMAQHYLDPHHRVVGRYIPTGNGKANPE